MSGNTKKLSLEERLSLAAKKGKKKTRKPGASPASASPPPPPLISGTVNNKPDKTVRASPEIEQTPDGINDTKSGDSSPVKTNEDDSIEKTATQVSETSVLDCQLWSSWLPDGFGELATEELLRMLQPHVEKLVNQNRSLKKAVSEPKSSNTDSSLVKLIREKDEIIEQLRLEGDKLSKIELRQCNLIKTLKKKIVEQDDEILYLQVESTKIQTKNTELEQSIQNLLKELKGSKDNINQLQHDHEEVSTLKSLLVEKETHIANLKTSLETKENDLRETTVNYKQRTDSFKAATEEQILELESSLEQLRIELENSQKDGFTSSSNPSDDLRERYNRQNEDLKSTKANAQAIEKALNNKIFNLDYGLEKAKNTIKRLEKNLRESLDKNAELESKISEHENIQRSNEDQINQFQKHLEILRGQNKNLVDDYSLLQHKYDIQRVQLEDRIDQKPVENILELEVKSPPSATNFETAIPKLEDEWMIAQNPSSANHLETPKLLNEQFLSKDDSSALSPGDEYEISMELEDLPDEAADLVSLNPNSSIKNNSSKNLNKYNSENGSSARMNAQMVSKLGAEIRKYEVELSSLQDLCDRIKREKDEANNEIIKLLEENEKVNSLKSENSILNKQVEDLQMKLDTSLEILGEKTELVEELENDVADLKDMMKQQIQEMVKLQGY